MACRLVILLSLLGLGRALRPRSYDEELLPTEEDANVSSMVELNRSSVRASADQEKCAQACTLFGFQGYQATSDDETTIKALFKGFDVRETPESDTMKAIRGCADLLHYFGYEFKVPTGVLSHGRRKTLLILWAFKKIHYLIQELSHRANAQASGGKWKGHTYDLSIPLDGGDQVLDEDKGVMVKVAPLDDATDLDGVSSASSRLLLDAHDTLNQMQLPIFVLNQLFNYYSTYQWYADNHLQAQMGYNTEKGPDDPRFTPTLGSRWLGRKALLLMKMAENSEREVMNFLTALCNDETCKDASDLFLYLKIVPSTANELKAKLKRSKVMRRWWDDSYMGQVPDGEPDPLLPELR